VRKLYLLPIVVLLVVLGAVYLAGVLLFDPCPDGTDWLSWKDNTYPGCQSFEIREEGEYPWFGSIKAEYDLEVRAGQWICARVEANNDNYSWEVMIYWGETMAYFGLPNGLSTSETRCIKVNPRYYYGETITESVVHKAHWVGYGRGGVTARPILSVENEDLTSRE
jgi:hypothetical protein